MPVFFNKGKCVNPSYLAALFLWFPIPKSVGRLTEREASWQMVADTALSPVEAQMSFYQLQKIMVRTLLDGKTVRLLLPGTFCLTFKGEGAGCEEEVPADCIKKLNVRFRPTPELCAKLDKAHLKRVEKLLPASKSSSVPNP